MNSESGKITITAVLAVVFGLGLAASAYLNVTQSQRAVEDHNLLQGQITDLQYQVKKDAQGAQAAATSPTPTPLATPEPTPTPTPAVAGTASISLSQLGVSLTASDPVADLTYAMSRSGSYPVAALSTRSLVSKYPACQPSATNNALGYIVQKKTGLVSTGKLIKQAGVYNYFYIAPSGFCAADQAGKNVLAAARAAVVNSVLPTLSN